MTDQAQTMIKQLRAASRATKHLCDRGFHIREIAIYGSKPRIKLFTTPQCDLLEAVERRRITDPFGTEITMSAVLYGCQIDYVVTNPAAHAA